MNPKVSIIIPIYKVEKYLYNCINSVINQTLKEIQIILVDDESPDNCPQICDNFAKQDNRIRVIHRKNGGLGYARNSGLEIANGEFVAFLDGDDYVSEDMYEKLYEAAKVKNADTCFCCCYTDMNGKITEIDNKYAGCTFTGIEEVINIGLFNLLGSAPEDKMDNVMGMQVWRGLYSMDIIRRNNIDFCSEREFICEDAIFHIDYFRYSACFTIIEDKLYYYRLRSGSLSNSFRTDRFEKNKILFLEEKRRLSNYGFWEKGHLHIERMFLAMVRVCLTDAALNLKRKDLIDFIKLVVFDDVIDELLCSYPYIKNPLKQRFFNEMLATKNVFFICFVLKVTVFYKKIKYIRG